VPNQCTCEFSLCTNGLIKLSPVFNFTNILRAAFAQISFSQKIPNTKCKKREVKSVRIERFQYEKAAHKKLVKIIFQVYPLSTFFVKD